MSEDNSEKRFLPLGATARIFVRDRDSATARVRFSSLPVPQSVDFVYDSADLAHQAVVALRVGLNRDEECARNLREALLTENVVEFLRQYLPRDGVIAVQWGTWIRLSATGLECKVAEDEWMEIHVEDVLGHEVWEATGPNRGETSLAESFAYSRFRLSPAECWKARARVSRNDGLELLFGDD
jgi:hypothetical protein